VSFCEDRIALTVVQVRRGAESSGRAGTQALTLLSTPIVVHILQALYERPKALIELRREVGSPPQTTMRAHLRALTETDVVSKRRRNDFPGALDFELTGTGRDLCTVARVLRSWLSAAPGGPALLGSVAAKSAIKALAEGWDTNIVRALAAKPLSLTELNSVIPSISYPSLERRLAAMRMAGQIEKMPGRGRATPYVVSNWLRHAVAPLGAAVRWERLNVAAYTPPISRFDAEAGFLLALPLLRVSPDLTGTCRLTVEIRAGGYERLAGVLVGVEGGRVTSCATNLQGEADAWVSGSPRGWLRAVIEQHTDGLEMGGHCQLSRALLEDSHRALFPAGRSAGNPPKPRSLP
jgi:DNA-binding HxlR family transcriptional regulator